MSYNRPTLLTIYNRIKADMESRVTGNIKIPKVSLLGILAIVFAGAAYLIYGFLFDLVKQLFIDTATEWGLTRWGNVYNLPRKTPKQSDGLVSFTGTAGKVVPADTEVNNSDGYIYKTQGSFTVGTSVSVSAIANEAGKAYNTVDPTLTLVSPDPDIDSIVTVVSGFDTGTDIENIENWRIRLMQRQQNPPSSGNLADYVRWALEVDGVDKAWSYDSDHWLGAGTLGVLLATDKLEPVPAGILADATAHITKVKPVPAHSDIMNVVDDNIDITIAIDPFDNQALKDAIEKNLRDLFLLESSPGSIMLLSQIRNAVSISSVTDYTITQIARDGASIGVTNITTTVPHISKLRTVYFVSL